MAVIALVVGALPFASANGANRHREFLPVSPFLDEGASEELVTPQDFERSAAENPVSGSQVLFSRCRKAPFNNDSGFYPSLVGEADTIEDDIALTYADGSQCFNPQNEQNIAVDPQHSNVVITSANDYRDDFVNCYVYRSTDSGATWVNTPLPGWQNVWGNFGVMSRNPCGGDPVIAFDPRGDKVYFAALTYAKGKSGLAISRSDDGGETWNSPVMVTYSVNSSVFHDKEWLVVGPNGDVYLTWTLFRDAPGGGYLDSHIWITKSTAATAGQTWSTPTRVSDNAHPYNQGSQVVVQNDGAVVVAYEGAGPDNNPSLNYQRDFLVVARSTNGGSTFTNSQVARIYDDYSCYPTQLPGAQGRQTLTNMQFRINSFPSMALDPTTGKIAIVWADNKGTGNCGTLDPTFTGRATSNQVRMVTSTNGTRWSSIVQITSGPADKVFPSVGANAGIISVSYYTRSYATSIGADRRCGIAELDGATVVAPTDPDRAAAIVCLDYAMRKSTDNFRSERRLTNVSSNPYIQFAGSFIGDYTGTVVDSTGATYAVWTDFRGKPGMNSANQDTYVRRIS